MKFETKRGTGTRPRRLLSAGVVLVLTTCLSSCGSKENPVLCKSPRAISQLFDADPAATDDRDTWKNGIAIRTEAPPDTQSIVAGFRGPNSDTWKDSLPISQDRAQTIALRLGDGAVLFSVQILAPEGSEACKTTPDTTFGEIEAMDPLITAGATLPEW